MYVGDRDDNVVRVFTPQVQPSPSPYATLVATTVVTTLAGGDLAGAANGVGTAALFTSPVAVTMNLASGTLYVADYYNHQVRSVVAATGSVAALAGRVKVPGRLEGVGTNARFSSPSGVAVSLSEDAVYVADTLNSRLRKIVIATATVSTFAGPAASISRGLVDGAGTTARFDNPQGLTLIRAGVNAGYIIVADTNNGAIRLVRKPHNAASFRTHASTRPSSPFPPLHLPILVGKPGRPRHDARGHW
jgi:DNA-binding beta-propeller fold protein YncE